MSDRDRLIELIKKGVDISRNVTGLFSWGDVADYLLANGVIVPPVKVGQKVYWINFVTKEIETDIVIAIHQYENGLSIVTDTVGTKGTTTFSLNRFFEIMFLTKEEAEKALAERNVKNGKM